MRPGRWPTLHWAISVNSRPQSFVADRPRETHSVHSCTVCLKLRPRGSTPALQAACAMSRRITFVAADRKLTHFRPLWVNIEAAPTIGQLLLFPRDRRRRRSIRLRPDHSVLRDRAKPRTSQFDRRGKKPGLEARPQLRRGLTRGRWPSHTTIAAQIPDASFKRVASPTCRAPRSLAALSPHWHWARDLHEWRR